MGFKILCHVSEFRSINIKIHKHNLVGYAQCHYEESQDFYQKR